MKKSIRRFKPVKVLSKNVLMRNIAIVFLIMSIIYLFIYFRWVYPLHNLSKYQSKEWIKKLTENLILGINDSAKLYKVRQYEKNIISFWYCFWHFHTEQYTIWSLNHLHNKFSNKAVIRIYYYDFSNKIHKQSFLEIDFTEIKTFMDQEKIIIRYKNNYIQEIDMNNDMITLTIDTNEIKLKFNLTIDDYATTIPALMPRYRELGNIPNMMETKCTNEWASDNPMIGKISKGYLNNSIIENGGNFWFDNAMGFNNYFLSAYSWFILLNDDWVINILITDTKENLRKKKPNMTTLLYIKDRKNNKILTCGVHTNSLKAFHALDNLINPKTVELNYRAIDDFDFHIEMSNFKATMSSRPNEVSQGSKTIIDDYYESRDINKETLCEWDKKYYNTLKKYVYTEMVTMAHISINYNNQQSEFLGRVVLDDFDCGNHQNKPCEIFCENNTNIRSLIMG